MANVKITELTAATALAGTDVLPIVDVGADATKKVSVSDLLRNLPDGTASAPALAFADDQNTGVLSPAANELAFATSGTQRLVIDSSGDVAIGNTSTNHRVLVYTAGANDSYLQVGNGSTGVAATNGLRIGAPAAGNANIVTDGLLTFGTGNVERLRIDSSGNVGIGNSSPANSSGYNTLTIGNGTSTGGQILLENSAGSNFFIWHDAQGVNIYNQSASSQKFYTNATERMRIDSSGLLLIGTSSAHNDTDLVEFEAATATSSQDVLIINGGRTGFNGENDANTAQGIRFKACAFNSTNSIQQLDAARIKFQKTNSWNTGGNASGVSGNLIFEVASGTSASTTLTERMRIDSSGVVNVGTTTSSPGTKFNIANGSDAQNIFAITGADTVTEYIALGIDSGVPTITAGGFQSTSTSLAFKTASSGAETERMRITSTGQVRLAGAGITFNGDTAAANELDDYEEGTFTPVLNGTGSVGTGTYTLQQGRYTKIGRTVSIDIVLTWTAHTGIGTMFITGLPFTFGVGFGYRAPLAINTTGVSATVAYGDGAYSNISIPTTIAGSGTIYINGSYRN